MIKFKKMWSLLTVTALITLTACGSSGTSNENAKNGNATNNTQSEADAAFAKANTIHRSSSVPY